MSRKKNKTESRTGLRIIHSHVAGIDLGSLEHWGCCPATEDQNPNVRTFATHTHGLEKLCDWLVKQGVHSVAMESTGVYWIPL